MHVIPTPSRQVGSVQISLHVSRCIALLLFACVAADSHESRRLIIGGAGASPDAFPSVASLQRLATHTCGAHLASAVWAVTAAHCIVDDDGKLLPPQQLRLLTHEYDLGATSPSSPCSAVTGIMDVIPHPEYAPSSSGSLAHDIALLRLSEPRPDECLQGLPRLDLGNSDLVDALVREKGDGVVAGWGRTSLDGALWQTYPRKLREIAVPIVNEGVCSRNYGASYSTRAMICAGGQRGRDTCLGDSGSPMLSELAGTGERVVIGITSWGLGCTAETVSNGIEVPFSGCANWDNDLQGSIPSLVWCCPGAAYIYCNSKLPSYTQCTDSPEYEDEYGGCDSWEGFLCTIAHWYVSDWSAARSRWLVYSCPESCMDVAALIDSFATCDPPVIVSAEHMTLEDLGDDKVQATIVQAEGGPAAEDITAAAEQLAFLTRMAEQLGVAKVGFDAPPVTVTVDGLMNTPAKTLVTMAQCSSCGRWLLSLWERPLQCCAWGAVAFGGDGGALVPSAIAATRCKRPSVESCRDCG
ncbi:hypothetical protein EMIHUDRAFT_226937 [Emiliania huxleyi CCMP1516]|uniref:Peptidase S1 domain-containing protein n=2 Tax=Emiliania huxleyi TaxID=2903 RepID=A0A0D3KJY8_EMIH1|nr:hypothetical protein EMIHUDRAFT_226937 [Emiliania huxleyi CCMP1516]EOD36073.1 hypothetical protein EMIHUDRAFT_226937 [Emiliania huxleyi CCMP1516]|eukprot:XP_005788502.1 hypothetical protein EMIHUDRAFT_226937 [Emiliania huxleyi CCMP1516]